MVIGDRYAEAFWPLAAAPLVVAGVSVAVAIRPSAMGVGALVVLAIAAALCEVVVWRDLQRMWSGERDSLWFRGMRKVAQLVVLFPVAVAVGSWKAHDIQRGTWPEAVQFSALMYGGLFTVCLIASLAVSAFDRYFNRPYKPQ